MREHNVPQFILTANIWHAGHLPPAAPDLSPIAQLHVGVQHRQILSSATLARGIITRHIYFPPGTDVRAIWPGSVGDLVEIPAGSGRYYDVLDVDDVAKGFPNEFRIAAVQVTASVAPPFPVPYP